MDKVEYKKAIQQLGDWVDAGYSNTNLAEQLIATSIRTAMRGYNQPSAEVYEETSAGFHIVMSEEQVKGGADRAAKIFLDKVTAAYFAKFERLRTGSISQIQMFFLGEVDEFFQYFILISFAPQAFVVEEILAPKPPAPGPVIKLPKPLQPQQPAHIYIRKEEGGVWEQLELGKNLILGYHISAIAIPNPDTSEVVIFDSCIGSDHDNLFLDDLERVVGSLDNVVSLMPEHLKPHTKPVLLHLARLGLFRIPKE